MTALPATRQPHSLFPEFSDLCMAFPSFAGIRPMFDTRLVRLEDEMTDGRYEVRAEMPGHQSGQGRRYHRPRRAAHYQSRTH